MIVSQVSIFEEGTVIIWDAEDGRQLKLIQAHQMAITRSLELFSERLAPSRVTGGL